MVERDIFHCSSGLSCVGDRIEINLRSHWGGTFVPISPFCPFFLKLVTKLSLDKKRTIARKSNHVPRIKMTYILYVLGYEFYVVHTCCQRKKNASSQCIIVYSQLPYSLLPRRPLVYI